MTVLRTSALLVLFITSRLALPAQPSVLHTGDWYKFAIERDGVYRISFDALRQAGVDPSAIDPKQIRIFGRKGGMLPQSNAVPRPHDLVECAIVVTGQEDGRFDRNDHILFYGEGPDHHAYNVNRQVFLYENNLYSDYSYYFLTIGPDEGKRIMSSENVAGDFPVIKTFNAFSYYENDAVNLERSGREWYGEKFGTQSSYTLTYDLPGITPGSEIKIVSDVMAQSHTDVTFNLSLNNVAIGEQKIAAVPNARYAVKGLHNRDTIVIAADEVMAPSRNAQEIRYEFIKGTGLSNGYLNYVLLTFIRNLALYGNQTSFVSAASLQYSHCTFEVAAAPGDLRIWDITDHYNVRDQAFTYSDGRAVFSTATAELKRWIVFNNQYPEPEFVGKVSNRDLSGLSTPNLLIITHPLFLAEAERLAAHRATFSGWTVAVATTEEIYNQFSGGRQDVSAIRDFAKVLRDKDVTALKAILLFGKGSYDYKDRLANNTNFVPTYQSRNSLHPLQTYSSDDYFAFLEDDEGSWSESPAEHHTLDVGIGRLPVTTAEQARAVVDKIIRYDTDRRALGPWRKKIVFVADDGNGEDNYTSLHQYQADQMATAIEKDHPAFDARRLFLGSYKKVSQPNGERVPDMVNDLKRVFDLGALIINFTGHGSETVWADERIFTEAIIAELRNDQYPFLVTATCEFGRQDDPHQISSAERSLIHPNGGSIGLVTTARPVNATTNFGLNIAFYEALFQRGEQGYATLGEVFKNTKNNSTSGVANRNFSLIGDPSMTLALPGLDIEVTSVKTASASDTLKALSTVIVEGHVRHPGGMKATDFDGIVEATLYDKAREFVTIGRNDPPFRYEQWDNAVFRGKASVRDGEFAFTFVLPKDISPEVASGRLGLYAFDRNSGVDAAGAYTSALIGGMEKEPGSDTTPPKVELFMGDTTFVNGGITSSDTYLVAKLEDENGINISGSDSSASIIAVLNGDQVYVLNDYFVSAVDTWQRGFIRFPMPGLSPGQHELTLFASDTYGNRAQASITFMVTDGNELVIESFGAYPNPFRERTTLYFTHNRSGDDLVAQLFIFNLAGQLITSVDVSVAESEYHIDLLTFETTRAGEKKLLPGPYLARVVVRSMTNGSKNEKVTRLILLN